jgi:Ser/Thr protein kinase RdoA (MazF antagonist)
MPRIGRFIPTIQYSLLQPESLQRLLEKSYQIARLDGCDFLARGFNDTYRIRAGKKSFYFRVYRGGCRSLQDVEGELAVLAHLAQSTSPPIGNSSQSQSLPIPRKDKRVISPMEFPEGTRYGVLFEEAPGVCITRPTIEECELTGRTLGMLHKKLDSVKAPSLTRPLMNRDYYVRAALTGASALLRKTRKSDLIRFKEVAIKAALFLSKLKRKPEVYGVCHGDIHARNLRIQHQRCTYFDFDFCGFGFRSYDLATYYWSRFQIEHDSNEDGEKRYHALLKGYQEIRTLTPEELTSIPAFVLLREYWAIGCKVAYASLWGTEGIEDRFWDQRFEFIDDWLDHLGQC